MPLAPRPTVYFRADGNTRIGLGHVMRCLALADMLAARFAGVLVVREATSALQAEATAAGCRVLAVPPVLTDERSEAAWLAQQLQPTDLLVLDGYHFGSEYQRVVSQTHYGLVCIDDLVTPPVWADAVINQAGGVAAAAYAAVPWASLFLGPAYALLRRPFRRPASPAQRPWTGRMFLSMGGADPTNQTAALLLRLAQTFPGHELDVVTGAAYPHGTALVALAAGHPQVHLHHNLAAGPLAALLRRCDLLVCPPSGMAYECAATGGLLLLHPTAANQQGMLTFLLGAGLALPLDGLAALPPAGLPALAVQMRTRQAALFDGQAGERLTAAFEELLAAAMLGLRPATGADCALYFAWANDPAVRHHAIRSAPIAWAVHQAWFARQLADRENTYLFVAEVMGQAIGQVRIEFDGAVGLIDYSVAAAHRGQGLGPRLLRRALHRLRHQRPGPWALRGEVWAGNGASVRVFERLRFARLPAVQRDGRTFEVFELAVNSGF